MVKLEDFVTHEDPKTKELKEAIMAGEKALNSLEEARNSFRSASNWGIFDMLGGSTLISLGKHSKMASISWIKPKMISMPLKKSLRM